MRTDISAYDCAKESFIGREKCFYYLGRSFSETETLSRIDGVADFFAEKGIGKGDVVAINLPNTPECIFTIYALNKLGAIAFITHPLLPAEALKEDIKRTGAKLLVCMESLTAEVGVPKILCDGAGFLPFGKRFLARLIRGGKKGEGERFPYRRRGGRSPSVGRGEDVALYLPSGGTMGEPKIIEITNRAFNANGYATLTLAKIPLEGRGVLLILPFFHGFGLSSSLHASMLGGAEGVIMPYPDYQRAAKYVKQGKVEIILAVPNMYKKLLAERDFRLGIGKMSLAFSGGDTLPIAMKKEFDRLAEEAGSPCRLYQGYGLAETVSVCTANSRGEDKAGTVGKPVLSEIVILDEKGETIPVGSVGEIAVKTDCMMKGYLGQAPFCDPYLRTGDIGFLDEEGYLHFSGRKKRIIVIGGMNVYPLEIERTAREIPFVLEAAAEEYRDGGKPKIALFITDKSEFSEEEKTEKILSYLSKRIIKYALPTKIIFLSALPLTPIGKVDHVALSSRAEL